MLRAALLVLVVMALVPAAPAGAAGPFAAHGMVYLDSPSSFKEAMFAQASALGASTIRVDVDVSEVVTDRGGRRWAGFDEDVALARKYRIGVMGVVLGTPRSLQRCDGFVPRFFRFRCPERDFARYARYVGEIVRRSHGAIRAWQVMSEPDNPLMYHGSVHDYARRLVATARAIHAADPHARVVLADLASDGRREYLARLLREPGVRGSFDIAALSLRGSVRSVVAAVPKWRKRFSSRGFHGPIWVTEHGYPADPAYQWDPKYRGPAAPAGDAAAPAGDTAAPAGDTAAPAATFATGEAAQAAYLAASLPRLVRAGAARVFVTLRDSRGGPWASEGLLTGSVLDPPQPDPVIVPRPAAAVFQRLAVTR